MAVKNEILAYLEQHRDQFSSGEAMAKELGISRAGVWKAVESLKKDGYQIHAVTRKGYQLAGDTDILSAESIQPFLNEKCRNLPIQAFSSLESTNRTAKQHALAGAKAGTVILAEEQTMGSGRLGRSFYSPAHTGIYLSVILRPNLQASDAILVTTAAAVAICRAIQDVTGLEAQIKWVNDLYVGGRKVCGILTEALMGFESGVVECVILGIGLNFSQPEQGFSLELREKAGALFAKKPDGVTRNRLTGAILNHVFSLCGSLQDRSYLDEYRQRSLLMDKEITFFQNGRNHAAVVCGIDEDAGLVIRYPDGTIETLRSGEISVRFSDQQ